MIRNENGTILIIEDNELSLKMAKNLLQIAGYNILEAGTADLGIRLARECRPNLILMDMHLPVKSGYQASRELKADPETDGIPIVAFTALAMQEEQQRAIEHGCTGIISKPIDIRQFAKTVETFLMDDQSSQPGRMDRPDPASDGESAGGCPRCADADSQRQDVEEFLYHVSHDLQGPLRKIQQFARLVDESTDASSQSTYTQGISRCAREMESLLQGLLTLSRVNGKSRAYTEMALNDVVSAGMHRHRQDIQARGGRVEVGALATIRADRAQIQAVFEELLANALKFQPQGQPPVIRISGEPLNDGHYEITVADNGIGLAAPETERIFQPFYRLHGVSQYPGHGLGLAIVKRIVERHGGAIAAESAFGHGTVMKIRLPVSRR